MRSTLLLVPTVMSLAAPVALLAALGDLDPSFGGGIVRTSVGDGRDEAFGVLVQPDGRIVVAGYTHGPSRDLVVARYETDGALDATFGTGGLTIVPTNSNTAGGTGVARQADGKLVVATSTMAVSGSDLALVRLNADGTLDAGFGTGGVVVRDLGALFDFADDLLIDPSGRFVVTRFGTIARLDVTGALDQSFGSGGVGTFLGTTPKRVIRQPDGKLVLAGDSSNVLYQQIARLLDDGTPDPAFAGDGVLEIPITPPSLGLRGLALQADGKIVAAGPLLVLFVPGNPPQADTAATVLRVTPAGALDTSFGAGGFATVDLLGVGFGETFDDVVVQPDGRILAVGKSGERLLFARFEADGTPDASFGGGDGVALHDPGAPAGLLHEAARQADGRVVVAGTAGDAALADSDLLVARIVVDSACGDGVADPPEACDDGNLTDGDCCSSSCTVTAGVCDDGNACTAGDQCSQGQCAAAPVTCSPCFAPCDTIAGCVPLPPAPSCETPEAAGAILKVKDAAPEKDQLQWKWRRSDTSAQDFGDPLHDTDYAFCLYDGAGNLLADAGAPGGGTCGGKACWTSPTPGGFKYRDRLRSPDGIEQLKLQGGHVTKLLLKARGPRLGLPGLPLALPARAQLRSSGGACWEASYSAAGARRTDATQFFGKSD